MNTLDQWEAEAKFFQDLKKKIEGYTSNTGFMDNEAKLSKQVLALIDLVRKTHDEIHSALVYQDMPNKVSGFLHIALALTDELK